MAEPTTEELLERIRNLEKLVTTQPQQITEPEYSFPTKNRGISQYEHQQMELANGDGVIISDGSAFPYHLTGHETDAITNEQNTLILRVARNTGKNEARLAGFYHRMDQDMELEFPAVTSDTTYYVCITYDPRKFKDEPLKIEVYPNTPPTENGRQHIVLHTVERKPNQLLSKASRSIQRQYVSPTITVSQESALPDPTSVLYGTLGIVRSRTSGGDVVPGTGQIFESRGSFGWYNLLIGEWNNIPTIFGSWTASWAKWRRRNGGVDVVCRMNHDGKRNNMNRPFALPTALLRLTIRGLPIWSTDPNSKGVTLSIDSDTGYARFSHNYELSGGWFEANFFIPDYYLA